jgi:hypothetical protein
VEALGGPPANARGGLGIRGHGRFGRVYVAIMRGGKFSPMKDDADFGACPPGEPITPQVIRQESAKIREGWSEAEHCERAGILRRRWMPPGCRTEVDEPWEG